MIPSLGQSSDTVVSRWWCRGGGVDLRALPGEHPQTHAAGRQGLHGVDRVGEVAAEAGELPDDEHVARSARAHAAVESRAVVAGTGREVVVDVDGVDARGLQRTARQVQRLGAVRLALLRNSRSRRTGPRSSSASVHALRSWHSKLRHPVQHSALDRGFDFLALDRAGREAYPEYRLVP